MTKWRVFAVCVALVAGVAALPARAQSCAPGGTVVCGPTCGVYYDIVVDGHFEEGCAAWDFSNGVQRSTGSMSCGSGSYHARVTGSTWTWQEMFQWVEADQEGNSFWFRYAVESDDADSVVEVYIDGPDDDPQIHSVTNLTSCETFNVDLGYHPEWVGEIIGIYIRISVPDSGKVVKIDRVHLWQSP